MQKQLWSPPNTQSAPLSQWFSTYELWHLWGTHLRYREYELFTLRFITVTKLQLWSSNKIILWLRSSHEGLYLRQSILLNLRFWTGWRLPGQQALAILLTAFKHWNQRCVPTNLPSYIGSEDLNLLNHFHSPSNSLSFYFLNPSFIYSLLNHWISDHVLYKSY